MIPLKPLESLKRESFPKEVAIVLAALRGEIKDTLPLKWARERCKDSVVLLGVTRELQRKGVTVKPHWVQPIITEFIFRINKKMDRSTRKVQMG